MRTWSRYSRRTGLTSRSAKALAFGARIGVRMTRTPSVSNTPSKGPENLASRSRRRNRTPESRSSMARFPACWVTRAESGVCGDADHEQSPGRELDEEEHVEAPQPKRLDEALMSSGDHLLTYRCAPGECLV